MSKIAVINSCIECPHCLISYEAYRCGKMKKILDELKAIENKDIPDWCPLEDSDEKD